MMLEEEGDQPVRLTAQMEGGGVGGLQGLSAVRATGGGQNAGGIGTVSPSVN